MDKVLSSGKIFRVFISFFLISFIFTLAGCQSQGKNNNPFSSSESSPILDSVPTSNFQLFPFYYGSGYNRIYGLIDADGIIIQPPQYSGYYYIASYPSYKSSPANSQKPAIFGLTMYDNNDNHIYYDAVGTAHPNCYIQYSHDNYGRAFISPSWYVMDLLTGQFLTDSYEEMNFISKELLIVTKNDNCYLLNLQNQQLTLLPEKVFDEYGYLVNNDFEDYGLYPVHVLREETAVYGYINQQGELLLNPEYEAVGEFSQGQAVVRTKDEQRLIDINFQILTTWPADSYIQLSEFNIAVQMNNNEVSIPYFGLYKRDVTPLAFLEGYFLNTSAFGYVQVTEYIDYRSEKYRYISKSKFFDPQGQEIDFPYPTANINFINHERWILTIYDEEQNDWLNALTDQKGNIIIPFGAYSYLSSTLAGGFVIGYNYYDQTSALISLDGEVIIDYCRFIEPLPDDSRFWIERGSYNGYIDPDGNWLFKQSRFYDLED